MRILILGAGYIGLSLIKSWSNREDRFWATTTSSEKLPLLSSLSEKAFLLQEADEVKLAEWIKHCEGMVVCVAPKSSTNYEKTYLQIATAVCKALEKRNRPFYLLYTSSTSVYGDHQGKWIDEQSPLLNTSDNGNILRKAENLYISSATPFIKVCVLRLAGIYGPERELEKRARALSGKTIPGQADSPTNHIHRDSIMQAIEHCFKNQLEGIFNLANDDHRTREELYGTLCREMGIPAPIWTAQYPWEHSTNGLISNKKILKTNFSLKEIGHAN